MLQQTGKGLWARLGLLCSVFALGAISSLSGAQERAFDTQTIESVTRLKGTYNKEEGVFKVSLPRSDVKVVVDGVAMPPFMGFASYAAFARGRGSDLMVMGDTVLLQDEVNAVMSVALESGLSVTALHNHFFFDEPRIFFMHVGGEGDAGTLAGGIRKMYDKIAEIRAANARPAVAFPGTVAQTNAISPGPLEDIFGVKGESNNGMFKAVFGRTARMHGVQIGKEMGLNTWAAFAGSDDNAVVDGDFAVLEDELQAVLKALRRAGINIVAIHQHMSHEQPRYLFLHYWGKGKAADLAHAVKTALAGQQQARVTAIMRH